MGVGGGPWVQWVNRLRWAPLLKRLVRSDDRAPSGLRNERRRKERAAAGQ